MRTLVVSLCTLCLACCAPSAAASTATPTEGTWSGISSAGLPLSFEVKAGHVVDARFTVDWGTCGVYEAGKDMTVPIETSGHWKFPDPSGAWVEGDFVTADRAEGTVRAPARRFPGCTETRATFVATPDSPLLPEEKPAVRAVKNITSGQLATRPHRIVLTADASFYLYAIRWKSFGGPVARATGRAYTRTGCSTCPNREVERPRVTLRLSHLVPHGKFRVYEHLTYTLGGAIPDGFEHRGSQSML